METIIEVGLNRGKRIDCPCFSVRRYLMTSGAVPLYPGIGRLVSSFTPSALVPTA